MTLMMALKWRMIVTFHLPRNRGLMSRQVKVTIYVKV